MKGDVLMAQLPIVISPITSFLILYLLNRRFNYKSRLVELVGGTRFYKVLLVTIYIISIIVFYLVAGTSIFLQPFGTTILAVFLYLSQTSN